jgi:hypothetical protein
LGSKGAGSWNFPLQPSPGLEKIDQELCDKINSYEDVDELVGTAFCCITAACKAAFKVSKGLKILVKKPTVSWWTEKLTALRKRTNGLWRRYQRTTNNENLRQERKVLRCTTRVRSQNAGSKAKIMENILHDSDGVNRWNIMYKIASGKIITSTRLTTLEKEDGKYTTDTRSTIMHMLEHFVPDDREDSDSELHTKIRKEIQETPETAEDKIFKEEEIIHNLRKFNSKKAPAEDGLTSDILIRAFQVLPLFFTQLYNMCLREGRFPKQWKHSVIIQNASSEMD